MSGNWQERKRPLRLEGRYEFGEYSELRDFLDAAAELSEKDGLYPDMGFGKDYVNVTIHIEEGQEEIQPAQREFAEKLDGLSEQFS